MYPKKHSFIYRSVFLFKCSVFLWILFSGNLNFSFGQSYNFKHISIKDGLPQSQAFDIDFDRNNYAWIATQGGGVCRFNGVEFNYYTKADSLISNRVYSLHLKDSDLWIGQKGGLTHYSIYGKFIENFRFENDGIIVQDITTFKGEIQLATNAGLFTLKEDRLIPYENNPNVLHPNIFSFYQPEDSSLWVCSDEGLLSVTDGFDKLNKSRGLNSNYVNCALQFKQFWIVGTYGNGLNIVDRRTGKALFPESFNDQIILSLAQKSENEIWIGTMNEGLYALNVETGEFKNYRSTNGLSSNNIKVIKKDNWGNVWIGTSGGGISVYKNSPFVAFNSVSGLNSDYVFSSFYDRFNNLWVGTDANGVMRLNDTSVTLFDQEAGFYDEKVKAIYEDEKGFIWLGTDGKGLGVYSPYDGKDTIYLFNENNGLRANWIRSFDEDINGNLFLGTRDNGVYKLNRNLNFPLNARFSKVGKGMKDFPDRINQIFCENERLWFANPDGYYGFIEGDVCRTELLARTAVRNIIAKGDHAWIGTVDEGVLHIQVQNDSLKILERINVGNHLISNNVYQLIWDENYIWVGTEKGMQRILLDSNYLVDSYETFDFDDGFEGMETNVNACQKDYQGNLWFGTVDGLYQYIGGRKDPAQANPPDLNIHDVQVFYNSIDSSEFKGYFLNGEFVKYLILPHDKNHIGFTFSAIHYALPEKIRFRWFLEGADKNWTPATKNTVATYSNLSPGDYIFHLKSSIDDDWEGVEEQTLSFSIDSPFWQKTWFKVAYYSVAILILLIIGLIILFRVKLKNRRMREKFKLEKDLLELEQKALRLQMNPHFIFNVLNSIHNQIILNDSDKARYALSKFSKLMRRILENSREKFISIDDEIETVENYVQLEKLTNDIEFEFNILVDDDIDTSEEILPPLLLQPFIENAIIHGIKELGPKGRIDVNFKLLNDHLLECKVIDNGKGREAAAKANAQKESYHKSTALQVTQERLNNLNENQDYKAFEIIDKKNKDGISTGTEVILRIGI